MREKRARGVGVRLKMGEGKGSSLLPALLFLPSMFCKSKAVAKHSIDVNHQTFMQAKVLVIIPFNHYVIP